MQRQLQDVIKARYGVSKRTSAQVIKALTEIERNRQQAAASAPTRAASQKDDQVPDIASIVGGLLGGSATKGGGGLLGLILSLIASLFSRGGSGQSQSGYNASSILTDLLGGATHPSQAPDLASIISGLMSSGGLSSGSSSQTSQSSQSSQSNQAPDVEGLVTTLLSGGKKPPSRR